jgi:AraC family transcriptional regulator
MQPIAQTSRGRRDGRPPRTPRAQTRSFYEGIVSTAVNRIAGALDEALDLGALAAEARLSPLHFHRIFRGLVGETVLRLRLERAATSLVRSEASVTTIAFDAGYETHESFTRAFRDAFGRPPSEFRARARTQPANVRSGIGTDCQPAAGSISPRPGTPRPSRRRS